MTPNSVFNSDPSDFVIYNRNNIEVVEDYVGNFIIRTKKYVLCFWCTDGMTFFKKKRGQLKPSDYIEYQGVTTSGNYEDTVLIGKMPHPFMDKLMNYKELKSDKDIDDIVERYFNLVVFS